MNKVLYILIVFLPFTAYAEIYKTVDENGRVIFTDKPTAKAEQIEVRVNSVEGPATISSQDTGYSGKKVVMYSTAWCGVCKTAKKYMSNNGISYKEYDIEKNSNAHRKFKSLGGNGVPLIVVGKQTMSGFSAPRLESMLGRSK
ncbi:MAG: DUF4124 domain-containing protein [Gammaproteobacteria bacterium]|nr:MAG: DUF4124 domain-containing protein [Gammaproteobacteria bacterium]